MRGQSSSKIEEKWKLHYAEKTGFLSGDNSRRASLAQTAGHYKGVRNDYVSAQQFDFGKLADKKNVYSRVAGVPESNEVKSRKIPTVTKARI